MFFLMSQYVTMAQSITYFKNIDLFTLQGIDKIENKREPCLNIEIVNDTVKVIHFYQSKNHVHDLTFKRKDTYWISYEANKKKNCCDTDSTYFYISNGKLFKFQYDESFIAMSIVSSLNTVHFYTFKRDSIKNREYLIESDPTINCGLTRKINLNLENGILEEKMSCYVCYSNRLYFEGVNCFDMREFSLSWWHLLQDGSFQKMSCE